MNILFLFDTPINPSVGGVQRVTDVITRELLKRGHNVVFVATSYEYMMDYDNFAAQQYFINVAKQSKLKSQAEIKEILDRHEIQIIVNQSFGNSKLLKGISNEVGIISVCHTQPFGSQNSIRRSIRAIQPKTFKQKIVKYISLICPIFINHYMVKTEIEETISSFDISDYVCYISERFFPRVKTHVTGVDFNKMVAIHNPVVFEPLNSELTKENLIIWVGRVNIQSKNTLDFVKMWEIFHKRNPDWKAQIIGYGQDFEIVKEYITKNRISDIELVGRSKDVEKYYRRAKFVAVTSMSESWCMSITEGMAFGCIPCVYDTYETIRDMIDDGKSGLIVTPTPQQLAERINVYANNEKLRKEISMNSMKQVSKFSKEKIVDEWETLFTHVINNK